MSLNKHCEKNDLWISICGNEWRRSEGGGHSKGARMKMQKLLVGKLDGAAPPPEQLKWLDPLHQFDRDVLNASEEGGTNMTTLAVIAVIIAVGVALFLPQIKDALGLD
eukprot:gene15453-15341_t